MERVKKKIQAHPRLFWSLVSLSLFLLLVACCLLLVLRSLPGQLALIYLNQPTTNLVNYQGRTDVVLLGLGGNDNKAQDLTDTVLFVSLNHSGGDTPMLSLPRDLWLESMKAKINTAYHYGGIEN